MWSWTGGKDQGHPNKQCQRQELLILGFLWNLLSWTFNSTPFKLFFFHRMQML